MIPKRTVILSFSLQARKKLHKPKLLSPDTFRWGRGLPHEGVGAKKFGMSLETREIKLFGRDISGFCWDIPAVPEKFEKKKFVFNSRPPLVAPYCTIPRDYLSETPPIARDGVFSVSTWPIGCDTPSPFSNSWTHLALSRHAGLCVSAGRIHHVM